MEYEYTYETFGSNSKTFDHDFTGYLNNKGHDHWRVMNCSYCHDMDQEKMWASCLFERGG